MALSPHVDDKNRNKVKQNISKLQKEDTAQSAEKLKEQHNMGDKEKIQKPNAVNTQK